MDHLRHQKLKKRLRNNTLQFDKNFKLMNISANDMDKFQKNN